MSAPPSSLDDAIAVFERGLPPDLWTGAGAEALVTFVLS